MQKINKRRKARDKLRAKKDALRKKVAEHGTGLTPVMIDRAFAAPRHRNQKTKVLNVLSTTADSRIRYGPYANLWKVREWIRDYNGKFGRVLKPPPECAWGKLWAGFSKEDVAKKVAVLYPGVLFRLSFRDPLTGKFSSAGVFAKSSLAADD